MNPFERNPEKEQIKAGVKLMWPEGPSRRWSSIRCGEARLPYENGGFVGQYVCQGCKEPTVGVYRVISRGQVAILWLCAECAKMELAKFKPKKKSV
jgi:hypothetical protein